MPLSDVQSVEVMSRPARSKMHPGLVVLVVVGAIVAVVINPCLNALCQSN